MTYEEALKWLDEHFIGNLEVKELISYALEKQIPKKPYREYDEHGYLEVEECPMCHSEIENQTYCDNCGQAIDWH